MANRYWVGATGNWNVAANWNTVSGGGGSSGVPTSSDVAIFDANSGTGTVTVDTTPNILGINIGVGITINTGNNAFTISTSGYVQSLGTFNAGSSVITINGPWNHTGGTFAAGTSEVIVASSSATASARIFNHVTGNGFYKLTSNAASAASLFSLSSDIEVANVFTWTKGKIVSNTASYAYNIKVANNVTIGTAADVDCSHSTANIFFFLDIVGTGAQSITTSGGKISGIRVNQTAGTVSLLSAGGATGFEMGGTLVIRQGTLDNTTNNLNITLYGSYTDSVLMDTINGRLYMGTGKLSFAAYYNPCKVTMNPLDSLYDLEVLLSSGGSGTVALFSDITVTRNLTWTGGGISNGVGYIFTIPSSSVERNAVYSHNGNNYTAVSAIFSSTSFKMSGISQPLSSGTLTLVSGTGPATIAFSAFSVIADYSYSLKVAGAVTLTAPLNVTPGTSMRESYLELNGTGTQTITNNTTLATHFISGLRINKASGSAVLAGSATTLLMRGNLVITKGTLDNSANQTIDCYTSYNVLTGNPYSFKGVDLSGGTYIQTASLLKVNMWYGTTNLLICGNNSLYDLTIVSSNGNNTVTLGSDCIVTRNCAINSTGELAFSSYSLKVGGNHTVAGTVVNGTGTLELNGTGTQTVTTGGVDSTHDYYNFIINKTAGTVVFATNGLSCAANGIFRILQGTTVTFVAGQTYSAPIVGMNGSVARNVLLRSSTPGSQYILTATTRIENVFNYVDVKDCNSTGAIKMYWGFGPVDSGNNLNWFLIGNRRVIVPTTVNNRKIIATTASNRTVVSRSIVAR